MTRSGDRYGPCDAGTLAPALRDAIRAMDPTLPVFRQLTLYQVRAAATAQQRNGATVLAIFGTLALPLAAIGLHGVVLALGATQLLRSMLFGIAPTDAITFVAVSVLFLVVALVALVASWMPARRAARIDPVVAMRAE